ncbi:unnamed protein product [Sphagnum troendelagicum]|uniref:Uncharacterized protein n=1 Tax=Sphagnum troendelagicum TaxID=128251 RepID=A0ABP0UGU5_9BRYO
MPMILRCGNSQCIDPLFVMWYGVRAAGMPTATRAICGTMRPVIVHKVMVIPFRKKPQTGINQSTRWFFGHPSLLDTPEVKSVPEPADSEQVTASSVSVSGNSGESHVDGTKASEVISNDRPSTISIRKSLARMWPRQQIQPEF